MSLKFNVQCSEFVLNKKVEGFWECPPLAPPREGDFLVIGNKSCYQIYFGKNDANVYLDEGKVIEFLSW